MKAFVYTIGYGNLSLEQLRSKLEHHRIKVIFDVRRADSGSWCNALKPGDAARKTLEGMGLFYVHLPQFGRNQSQSLRQYDEWLDTDEGKGELWNLKWSYTGMENSIGKVALMCCERRAFDEKDNPECHRVYIARRLAKLLKRVPVHIH